MNPNWRYNRIVTITVCFLMVISLFFAPMAAVKAAGTISLTSFGTAFTENFDSLASSGTSSTLPTGWDLYETGTSANVNGVYTANTGSSNGGDTYSFGATGSTERAFGTLLSGTITPTIGVGFTNNAAGTINSLTITYTGEQWRLGTSGRSVPDRLDFQLSTDAASLSTGTWADYNDLDFSDPVVTGTIGVMDGNLAANRTSISYTITGLNIPKSASFWLRWLDINATGSDDGLAVDDFSITASGTPDILDVAPTVSSTGPTDGTLAAALDQDISVTFSEPVHVADGWYAIRCSTSGVHTASVSGGPMSFTLNPDANFVNGDVCTLTVIAPNVTDQDVVDPPDLMFADFAMSFTVVDACQLAYTPIYSIQGSGPTAAITGSVVTKGVVVGDYEGPSPALQGFFLQDLAGDGNPATSDGIFVYEANKANSVNLGDVVRVTGIAGENQGQTQVSSSQITQCGTGTVTPTEVTLPFTSATDAERYEGMLVRLPQTMYVTEIYLLGRFDQVLLSANARLEQPTNVTLPGVAANALQQQNNLNKILVDDASQAQNPDPILFGRNGMPLSASNTLRGGDTTTGIVGVMTYTWGGASASANAYRVRPINALNGFINFEGTNPRPDSAPALTGSLRVVGMNLLNFFNSFTGCTNGVGGAATACRGAENPIEFDRQLPKTVAAITGTNADVIGLTEMENDGYGPTSAIQSLVDALNAATAPGSYAFMDVDAGTGQVNALGTDAIKVALLYKTAKVTPVGITAALNSEAFVNGGDPAPRNRAALAQAFEEVKTGARFVVSVNHFKSKGSGCTVVDANDGQGGCNIVRTQAATLLASWLASDPTGTKEPDALIIGDLNSYAMEDPITALQAAGYIDLVSKFEGSKAYSYVFDGQWGYLDHALSNTSLTPQITKVADWHINADEPSVLDYNTNYKSAGQLISLYAPDQFRIADHDPVLIDLNLTNEPPSASAGGPYSTNEGTTVGLSASGSDPEGKAVSFAWDLNNDGVFETVGQNTTFNAVDGPGDYLVIVKVTDISGLSTTASANVHVDNVAPVLNNIAATPVPVQISTALSIGAAFTDVGILDTHTARIDWGDGNITSGTVTETKGSGFASGTHIYTTSGIFTIRMTVTDKDGAVSNEAIYADMVVYDPAGGFVTGGGWMKSLAGAYLADPLKTGKAVFGFSAKYDKNASVPTGEVTFQLQGSSLNFTATGLDWLIVNRQNATAQFKASGTLNGVSGYQCIIWLNEGNPDKFRIKIWASNGQVVYDNGVTQSLGGGSIKIHK